MHKDQSDEKIEQVINAQKNLQKPEIKTVEIAETAGGGGMGNDGGGGMTGS